MGLPVIEEKLKTKRQHYEDELRQTLEGIPLEKIDPSRTVTGQLRIERTLELLEKHVKIEGSAIADLGCGALFLASLLAEKGGKVTAVDASEKALSSCQHPKMATLRACLPYLPFPDTHFDGIVLTDVIAEIEPHLYRLTLSELSRILKSGGWLICSTPLDIQSHDAHERFSLLIQTEFEIFALKKSYHRLHIYLTRWIKAPFRFIRGAEDSAYRLALLQKRRGLFRLWFYLNTIKKMTILWKPTSFLLHPLLQLFQKNRKILLFCESFSEILWGTGALTDLIVLARKKKM